MMLGYTYLIRMEKDQFNIEKEEKKTSHVGSEKRSKVLLWAIFTNILILLLTRELCKSLDDWLN